MNIWLVLLVVVLPLLALWIRAGVEIIRRRDLPAARRLGWIAGLVFVPVVGLAAYIVSRTPPELSRSSGDAGSARAEQIVLLAEQRQRGALDDDEYLSRIRDIGVLVRTSEKPHE